MNRTKINNLFYHRKLKTNNNPKKKNPITTTKVEITKKKKKKKALIYSAAGNIIMPKSLKNKNLIEERRRRVCVPASRSCRRRRRRACEKLDPFWILIWLLSLSQFLSFRFAPHLKSSSITQLRLQLIWSDKGSVCFFPSLFLSGSFREYSVYTFSFLCLVRKTESTPLEKNSASYFYCCFLYFSFRSKECYFFFYFSSSTVQVHAWSG